MNTKVVLLGLGMVIIIAIHFWMMMYQQQPCTESETQKKIISRVNETLKQMESCSCKNFCHHE